VRGLPVVFDTKKRPWVQPNKANAGAVAEVVLLCPSGALHYERKDGGAAESIPRQNIIMPVVNGPLYVSGNVRIQTNRGELTYKDTRLALCRCGASENKPFCDRSHLQIEFQDAGMIELDQAKTETVTEHGLLTITPLLNGPLQLQGNYEIHTADGQIRTRGKEEQLCRCGRSGNKPFCDSTHEKIGFTT
jgi:CDGSH-type Zn-finger protein